MKANFITCGLFSSKNPNQSTGLNIFSPRSLGK
ncbi:hypothetical protein J2067_001954 [Erwinia rhapontici]|nr:hypothetical protein [Erwinia rhapontici]